MFRRIMSVFALAIMIVAGSSLPANAGTKDKTRVFDFASGAPVSSAFSMLDRGPDGVATKVRTRGIAGDAYTGWYVIFNAPGNCSDGVCGEDDIFNTDGSFNASQIEAARIAVVWSQAGAVANPAGRIKLDGGLAEGEVPGGVNQVVIGLEEDGALVPLGVVSSIEDTMVAEIHIVLQNHGPAHSDAALLDQQLTMFHGACNPECIDVQFAVHLP